MIVYLAHAKANYASEGDGYVMALRGAEHPKTLYSFHYITGQTLPIHENLRSSRPSHPRSPLRGGNQTEIERTLSPSSEQS